MRRVRGNQMYCTCGGARGDDAAAPVSTADSSSLGSGRQLGFKELFAVMDTALRQTTGRIPSSQSDTNAFSVKSYRMSHQFTQFKAD